MVTLSGGEDVVKGAPSCQAAGGIKRCGQDFPGGTVVKTPPANAGDTGSSPGPERIPHAAEQLSPCATTTKPALQSPRATTTEARVPRARALPQEKPLQ